MSYFRYGIRTVGLLLIFGFLHYTLPQYDVVRINDTYEKRVDFGSNRLFWANADAGSELNATNRDVFFIQTFQPNDSPMIYRNEDTGWGWPPYFKFDTSNLQARAADAISTAGQDPNWMIVKHYGWRNELLSTYPNALSVKPATGPDQRIIPWLNIIIITFLVALFWAIWIRWVRFRKKHIDPVTERIGDWFDDFISARKTRN